MHDTEILTLSKAFDQSDLAFCIIRVILDDAGKPCDWEFAYLNDALARMEGLSIGQLLHRRFFEVFPQADTKWFDYYYPAAYENKHFVIKEISEEIGVYLKIHCFPVAYGYCGCILEDIRELEESLRREQAGDALIRGLTKYYATMWLVKAPNMTMHLYQRGGKFTTEEEILKEMSSYSYEDGRRMYITKYVHPDDQAHMLRETAPEAVAAAVRQQETYTINYRRCYGGQTAYYQLDYAAVAGSDSFVMAFRNVNEIVQEQQKQEQALQAALAYAQQANAAKTTFLSNMSHDIRTPMNAIMGFTTLALSHIGDQKRVKEYLKKIAVSSSHLLALLNDVLDMSRIEAGRLQLEEAACCLPEEIRNACGMLQSGMEEKGLHLDVDMAGIADDLVLCDRVRLHRVLLNLLDNARKFTAPGGCISVRLREVGGDDDQVCFALTICDNGIGMSEKFQKRMFEPFERERSSTVSGVQGTGLGLAITKRIVDAMGGRIDVSSKPGVGTTFVLTLMMKRADRLADNAGVCNDLLITADEHRRLAGKRVLLVEDNALNRDITEELLTEVGLVIETAEDGLLAVERIRERGAGYYDLVLMDVQMPVMDGYTATRAIRAMDEPALAELPIIAMTANAFEEDKRRAREAGMNDHLAKPINVDKLLYVMQVLLR